MFLKYILLICFCFLSFPLMAANQQGWTFQHAAWKDTLVETGKNRLCRQGNNDCATVIRRSPELLTLRWDKWGEESFIKKNDIYTHITSEELADMFVYDIKMPFVQLNPYGRTPLSAQIKFETEQPARIILRVKGIPPAEDIVAYFNTFTTKHAYPVLGLYPKHKNIVELTAVYQDDTQESRSVLITTSGIPHPVFYHVKTKNDLDNYYYWSNDGLIFDEYGYVRFYTNAGFTHWFHNEIIVDYISGLERLSPLGKSLQKYTFPEGFYTYRHGLGRMPNKNILIMGTFPNTPVLNNGKKQVSHRDYILELDYQTGREVRRWDLAKILNPDRHVIVKPGHMDYGKNDWIHTNSIMYDSDHDALIISGRHIGMASVDYQTGALNWVMGPNLGYEKSGRDGKGPALTDKVLTAINRQGVAYPLAVQQGYQERPDFKWPTTTHDAKALGKGYYSIFDNNGEAYHPQIAASYNSRPVIYRIDHEKKTIEQIWSLYLNRFSPVGSSIFWQPDTPFVFAFIAQAEDKNANGSAGYVYRFDFATKKPLFEAAIKRAGDAYYYTLDPVLFYPPENRYPPQEENTIPNPLPSIKDRNDAPS